MRYLQQRERYFWPGEITSKYEPDVLAVAEDVVEKVGYQAGEILFDALIHQQSPDIAQGVQTPWNPESSM